MSFNKCICGVDLRDAEVSSVAHLAAETDSSKIGSPRILRCLGALSIYGLAGKLGKKAVRNDVDEVRRQLEAGVSLAEDWPDRFFVLLDQYRIPVAERGSVQLLREAFPGLNDFCALISEPEWRERVTAAIDSYCTNTLVTTSPVVGRNSILETGPMTLKEVAVRVGRGFQTVASAIDIHGATIRGKRVTSQGRLRRVIAEVDVIDLKELLGEPTSVKEASRLLALPPSRIHVLARAGILSIKEHRLKKSEVAQVAKDLRKKSKSSISDQPTLSLRLALRNFVAVSASGSFMFDIQSDKLSIIASVDHDRIGEWQVSKSEVEAWVAARRAASATLLSLGQAAQMLSLKHEVVLDLVRKGFITGAVKSRGSRGSWSISHANVEEFHKRYGPLSELTNRAGINHRDGFLWAQSQGLKIVSGPRVDGSRQYIVERTNKVFCS